MQKTVRLTPKRCAACSVLLCDITDFRTLAEAFLLIHVDSNNFPLVAFLQFVIHLRSNFMRAIGYRDQVYETNF